MTRLLLAWLLTAGLGADDWRAREAASARLAALQPEAEPALWLCQWSEDLETRVRAGLLRLDRAALPRLLAELDDRCWLEFDCRPWRAAKRLGAGLAYVALGGPRPWTPPDDWPE